MREVLHLRFSFYMLLVPRYSFYLLEPKYEAYMLPCYVKLAKFGLYSHAPSPFTEFSKCFFKNLSLHLFEDSAEEHFLA